MKESELKYFLQKGEGTTVEFKKATGGVPGSLYETVVSFSNTDGGTIVLGADDEGAIIGVAPGKHQKYIQEIVSNLNNPDCVSPALFLQPVVVQHEDGAIIVLRVPASSQLHQHAGRIYWRSDDNDQDITADQHKIAEIYHRKREYFSESTIYPFLELDDLSPELFDRARRIISTVNSTHPWLNMSFKEMLTSASLYRKDFKTGEEGLTLAAALVFGTDETIGHLLPGYKVDALVRRENLDRYDDRLLLRTNLIDTYASLLNFIKRHLPERFYQEGEQRKDLRELIFREVVGNLIVHREYTNAHSSELIIEKDRVLVTNPNKPLFHGPLDPENFNPYPKNPNIRKFFTAFGWTDELGSGVRNVTHYLDLYVKGAKPVFMENDIFITEIPLVNVTLADYKQELCEWLDFPDEVSAYLSHHLDKLSLDPTLNEVSWKQVLLNLVPSWTRKGTKLKVLDWPDKQVFKEDEIKKVASWDQKGTKLLHKKVRYLIEILMLSLEPVPLDQLMGWMGYTKKQTFRDNYLKPLQQVGFINMTIPEVPRSPDQKYVTTEKGKLFLTGRE